MDPVLPNAINNLSLYPPAQMFTSQVGHQSGCKLLGKCAVIVITAVCLRQHVFACFALLLHH